MGKDIPKTDSSDNSDNRPLDLSNREQRNPVIRMFGVFNELGQFVYSFECNGYADILHFMRKQFEKFRNEVFYNENGINIARITMHPKKRRLSDYLNEGTNTYYGRFAGAFNTDNMTLVIIPIPQNRPDDGDIDDRPGPSGMQPPEPSGSSAVDLRSPQRKIRRLHHRIRINPGELPGPSGLPNFGLRPLHPHDVAGPSMTPPHPHYLAGPSMSPPQPHDDPGPIWIPERPLDAAGRVWVPAHPHYPVGPTWRRAHPHDVAGSSRSQPQSQDGAGPSGSQHKPEDDSCECEACDSKAKAFIFCSQGLCQPIVSNENMSLIFLTTNCTRRRSLSYLGEIPKTGPPFLIMHPVTREDDPLRIDEMIADPIVEDNVAPIDQENAAPIDEGNVAPIDEVNAAPIDQENAAPIDEGNVAPVDGDNADQPPVHYVDPMDDSDTEHVLLIEDLYEKFDPYVYVYRNTKNLQNGKKNILNIPVTSILHVESQSHRKQESNVKTFRGTSDDKNYSYALQKKNKCKNSNKKNTNQNVPMLAGLQALDCYQEMKLLPLLCAFYVCNDPFKTENVIENNTIYALNMQNLEMMSFEQICKEVICLVLFYSVDDARENSKKNNAITNMSSIEILQKIMSRVGKVYRKDEESSRPTREISSVMMTTSGFLSPAREGKLPESRTPIPPPVEPLPLPPAQVPEIIDPPPTKKQVKSVKRAEKKREKVGKELFRPLEEKKKSSAAKDPTKAKQKSNILKNLPNGTDVKISQVPAGSKHTNMNKANKALAAARLKTEKLNTTITPIPMKNVLQEVNQSQVGDSIDKLLTEPDKKKLNNLKKIFNVKDVKALKKEDKLGSRESSPGLIIDMPPDEIATKISSLPCDVTIEPINVPPKMSNSPDKSDLFDGSPPRTPTAPKTPEIVHHHSPPAVKEKRKRKVKVRRIPKHHHHVEPDGIDMILDRPKTPEVPIAMTKHEPTFPNVPQLPLPLGYPFAPFGGPGLIPAPLLPNPLNPSTVFPFGHLPFGHLPLGRMPHMRNPVPMPSFPQHPNKMDEPPVKVKAVEKVLVAHTGAPPHRDPPQHQRAPSPQVHPSTPQPVHHPQAPPTPTPISLLGGTGADVQETPPLVIVKPEKKIKEHKKDKKDKIKKKNKKDKVKSKSEKKKLKIEKKDKEKIKKEKKEKRKEKEMQYREGESPVPKLTLKLGSPSSRPATPEMKKLNIKPIVRKDDEPSVTSTTDEKKREVSPGLAKISALVTGPPKPKTNNPIPPAPVEEVREEPHVAPARYHPGPGRPRIHPIKPKPPAKPKKQRTPVKKDKDGNEVWICPACGNQDDGSPMIGCDDCDAWYHWVCVGIRTEPDENENWYCRHCLMKKNESLQSDKKKKRKKREKKDH